MFVGKSDPDEAANYFLHLGLKNFPDEKFSSSTDKDGQSKAKDARLDGDSAWCPKKDDRDAGLFITVPKMQAEIVGLVTQGYRDGNKDEFVRYYFVKDDDFYYTAGGKKVRSIFMPASCFFRASPVTFITL